MPVPVGGSLLALLLSHAERCPDRPAILAPGRDTATYADLGAQVDAVGAFLGESGIVREHVVALALPNGPELAVAFLGVAAAAACAPLAPDRPAAEHRRDLDRLGARAVVVERDADTAARAAAVELGITIVELTATERAGTFTLARAPDPAPSDPAPSDADARDPVDAALLLFTSGTTSAPKLVPLTEAGLLASAATVAATLAIGPDDRNLNVMPLFHIHGLVAGLLAPLHAGGSVVCTPGFRGPEVWDWIDAYAPTWYTAVPTIHQAMVAATQRRVDGGGSAASSLRFVRSSSAALAARVLADLETLLGVPVIEAYGMTEAAHQIASNPLPPAPRVPGTVGRATGTEITVRDEAGAVLPAGTVGEVVIRGPAVAEHYLGAPEATAAAFTDGWFRTGDQGVLDPDGCLTLTGRLKEIINRGGEKVAPREIDDVLLAHPEVEQAVAFAVAHPRLGEEVGAAVVLRDGAIVTGPQLRVFAAERLAAWKVPRRVVVLDEIPRGATGKLDRLGLPARLGLDHATDAAAVPPADETERTLAAVWQDVLGDDALPSVTADFFELGGDSLHANELLEAVESTFGRRLPATVFFTSGTVRAMADLLRDGSVGGSEPATVAIQPHGARSPLFGLMRAGSVVTLRHLAATLGPDQPLYGLWVPAMHATEHAGGSVEELAATCVALVRTTQPHGPYLLFGHSMGGIVCFEMARQLHALDETVALVAIADAVSPEILRARHRARRTAKYRLRKVFSRKGPAMIAYRVRHPLGAETPQPRELLPGTDVVADMNAAAARERAYRPGPAVSPVAILATRPYLTWTGDPSLGWAPLLGEGWVGIEVPGDHDTMIGEPHVHVLAARLAEVLGRARAGLALEAVSPE
ncbi:MAG: AMP-binding protein [Acidimicrobiia bacterium]|jgi:acyl-CoA synthetase (AMP-forming)/AMP-acid ligase II/thioesterase domain-containing protein/acyl carrier protein